MEAVRYPEDFNGIIAGAPANNQFQLGAWRINLDTTIRRDPRRIGPRNKMVMLNRAVLAACDTLDGVKDGLLSDPTKCHFDPTSLLCRDADNDSCLTASQLESVKLAYAPATKRNGELIYPGLVPGGVCAASAGSPDGTYAPFGVVTAAVTVASDSLSVVKPSHGIAANAALAAASMNTVVHSVILNIE